MLSITHLSIDYGKTRVVDDFNLQLGEDEILMLVGPTGCGKTTILQSVAGLLPITTGEVALSGWTATPQLTVAPEKRNVGMVFQDFALFPHLDVLGNVSFKLDDPAPAHHWLDVLGLSDFARAKPGRLSGGQKQRVALARALAHGPALMLLDEPLSNLDAALKDTLRWEIREALKAARVPAIWVTHDQAEALSVGDRLGILRGGKLEQFDAPERCFLAPANRFCARFLGEACYLSGQRSGDHAVTALGDIPLTADSADGFVVDVLLRPDDLDVRAAAGAGQGKIHSAQYEGGTWLYGVTLTDNTQVKARCHHQTRLPVGAAVDVQVVSTHPLMGFAPDTID